MKENDTLRFGQTDILVADTLIMMPSSTILLNKLKRDNYIRAKVMFFYGTCTIDGKGSPGKDGLKGKDGEVPFAPCANGQAGRNGMRGLDGTPGVNLYLYINDYHAEGELHIDLSGGDGGDGGDGGNGGGGSKGTVHCRGGSGADGGNAGAGGNGGDGGTLHLISANTNIRASVGKKIFILNSGGKAGYAGIPGYQGMGGTGQAGSGKPGKHGLDGMAGLTGKKGSLLFEEN